MHLLFFPECDSCKVCFLSNFCQIWKWKEIQRSKRAQPKSNSNWSDLTFHPNSSQEIIYLLLEVSQCCKSWGSRLCEILPCARWQGCDDHHKRLYSKPSGIMGGRSCHTYMDPRHYCCHMWRPYTQRRAAWRAWVWTAYMYIYET